VGALAAARGLLRKVAAAGLLPQQRSLPQPWPCEFLRKFNRIFLIKNFWLFNVNFYIKIKIDFLLSFFH
jgi:hypothetical protein